MGQPRSHVGPQFYWPFHIFPTKTSFCHMTKNIRHIKSPELFLWSPSLEACTINNLFLYMTNEADKLRCSVLHICSTSEIQIWDVSKNFQVRPFQQCKGMPADCFCNPNFCVIYMMNHLLFWPYSGFIFHFIQPNCQLLLTNMVLLHFWKHVPPETRDELSVESMPHSNPNHNL